MIGLYIFLFVFVLMILGVPITFTLAAGGVFSLWQIGFLDNPVIVTQQLLNGVNKPALLAIPFFIFAGSIMTGAGLSDKIFNAAHALVGHMKGGLAQVNVVASFVFGGISGSSIADIAGIGQLEVRAMTKRGYPLGFSSALTVVTSIIGPVIPPSIVLIIYAWLANESVARMFLAGIVPGILLAISFMIYVAIVARKAGYPTEPRLSIIAACKVMLDGAPALIAPGIILGAMIFGITTITEAGVLASLYAVILGFLYRNANWEVVWKSLVETALVTAMVMMIIGFAQVINWSLSMEQIPQVLADGIFSHVHSRWMFLLVLIVLLPLLGCLLEVTPAMILLVPLLLPLADVYEINRIQFGMIISLGLMIGVALPPMGIGLYVISGLVKVPLEKVSIAVLPMIIPIIITLLLIAFIPDLTLFLPNLLMK